jgi:NAD(P)-dependent dehydrogenase (short-subunit alcohol dehydrogenase family)
MTADIAVVLGSTSNIGKAIAERLSADGYHVVVTSRHGDEAEAVAADLPNEASGFGLDARNPDEIEDLYAFVDDLPGEMGAQVNNAAYADNKSVLACDREEWDRTQETNLRSFHLCTQAAAGRMKETGGGAVVNVTVSETGGVSEKISYMTSKAGIKGYTKSAALDLAPHGIRMNAVGSGLVGSSVGSKAGPDSEAVQERNEDSAHRIPVGRVGDPAELAAAVSFLVSEEASYVVGAILPVDGGKNIS